MITETLFCLTPFPLFLQVIMPRGRRRGRGRGRLAHTDIVSRPEVTLLWIYIAISLGCTSFCIYECCFEWILLYMWTVWLVIYLNVLFWLWYSIVPATVIVQELPWLICQAWLIYTLFSRWWELEWMYIGNSVFLVCEYGRWRMFWVFYVFLCVLSY